MFSSSSMSKVHPEPEVGIMSPRPSTPPRLDLDDQENSDDDDVQILEPDRPIGFARREREQMLNLVVNARSPTSSLPSPPTSPTRGRSSNGAGQRILEWDEMVEDLELAMEKTRAKAGLYHHNGVPLKRSVENAKAGLKDITEQIMNAYGLEFLGIISEILLAANELEISLPEILDQMENYFKKNVVGGREKLIIWVDDDDHDESRGERKALLFSHLLVTEIMRLGVQPDIVVPCHDFDEEVLVCLVDQVRRRLSAEQRLNNYDRDPVEFAKEVILQLIRIGLTVSLATAASNIILIDADSYVREEPVFRLMLEKADENGHTVVFFRNTAAVNDKFKEVEKFTEKVMAWHAATVKLETTNPTNFMKAQMTEDKDDVEMKRALDADAAKALIEEDVGFYGSNRCSAGSQTEMSQSTRAFRVVGMTNADNKKILKESNAIKSGKDDFEPEKKQPEPMLINNQQNTPVTEPMQVDSSESSDEDEN